MGFSGDIEIIPIGAFTAFTHEQQHSFALQHIQIINTTGQTGTNTADKRMLAIMVSRACSYIHQNNEVANMVVITTDIDFFIRY